MVGFDENYPYIEYVNVNKSKNCKKCQVTSLSMADLIGSGPRDISSSCLLQKTSTGHLDLCTSEFSNTWWEYLGTKF